MPFEGASPSFLYWHPYPNPEDSLDKLSAALRYCTGPGETHMFGECVLAKRNPVSYLKSDTLWYDVYTPFLAASHASICLAAVNLY